MLLDQGKGQKHLLTKQMGCESAEVPQGRDIWASIDLAVAKSFLNMFVHVKSGQGK